jgi:hypothetical protein
VHHRRRPLPGRALRSNVPRGTSRFSGPSARRKEICTVRVFCLRHSPVQTRQLQQARHHPASLAQWQLEKDLDRQAELDGRIAKTPQAVRACPHAARARSYPCRSTSAKTPLAPRCVGAAPVRRAIAGGRWLAPAARLTAWIHKVNPTCQSSATTPMATIRLWPLVDPVSVSNVQS